MIAETVNLHNTTTDTWTFAYILPDNAKFTPWETYTKCEVNGKTRKLLTSASLMAMRFNYEARQRQELGHDCGVYALSAQTGEPQSDILYAPTGGFRIVADNIRTLSNAPTEPDSQPGDILLTSMRPADSERFLTVAGDTFHYMVRATEPDSSQPLYFSKFGKESPVLLHPFQTALEFYGAQYVHAVADLQRRHISQDL